jgi:hypothetical protein
MEHKSLDGERGIFAITVLYTMECADGQSVSKGETAFGESV